MVAQPIPPAQWAAFFDQFSAQHHGERSTLESFGYHLSSGTLARDIPLIGLALTHRAGLPEVTVTLRDDADAASYSYRFPVARAVIHETVAETRDAFVGIETEDGTMTFLSCEGTRTVAGSGASHGRG